MAAETVVSVDDGDWIADVTIDAKGSCTDGRRVIMAMGAGEIVDSVALDAGGIGGDGKSPWTIEWILQ